MSSIDSSSALGKNFQLRIMDISKSMTSHELLSLAVAEVGVEVG